MGKERPLDDRAPVPNHRTRVEMDGDAIVYTLSVRVRWTLSESGLRIRIAHQDGDEHITVSCLTRPNFRLE